MSAHVQCPRCQRPASSTESPRKEWGTLYDGLELDRACERVFATGDENYSFGPRDGRETLECPCGGAIWIADRIADRQGMTGRWFTLWGSEPSIQRASAPRESCSPPKWQVDLWDAINRYAEACGADTSRHVGSPRRMNAVAEVESAVRASWAQTGSKR